MSEPEIRTFPEHTREFSILQARTTRAAAVVASYEASEDTNALSALWTQMQVAQAERPGFSPWGEWETDFPTTPPLDLVPAPEARKRFEDAGLTYDVPEQGMSRKALDIVFARRQAEANRALVDALGPHDWVTGLAKFGAGLAASAIDPLNIATAFVPVVSPLRAAAWAARYGVAGGRALVGLTEGVVGAAMLEPLIYTALRAEQADYDLTDSFLNLTFGGILGGGLHVGVGALRDFTAGRPPTPSTPTPSTPIPAREVVERLTPDDREMVLRLAVQQATSGRAVDVAPLVRVLSEFSEASGKSIREYNPATHQQPSLEDVRAGAEIFRVREELDLVRTQAEARVREELTASHTRVGEVTRELAALPERPTGLTDQAKAELVRFFDERLARADVSAEEKARLETDRDRLLKELPKGTRAAREDTAARAHRLSLEKELEALLARIKELEPHVAGATPAGPLALWTAEEVALRAGRVYDEMKSVVRRSTAPDAWDGADVAALSRADEIFRDTTDARDPAELERAVAELKQLKAEMDARGEIPEEVSREIAVGADLLDRAGKVVDRVERSKAKTRAADYLAACMWR